MAEEITPWTPPFPATGIEDAQCPKCEEEGVICVRDKESWTEGEKVDAYCDECHALLSVTATLQVMFGDVKVA